jgi:lambda repressor-like predicted transcriptional regulator
LLGRPRTRPLPDDPTNPMVQQWHSRQVALARAKAQVHALHERGVAIRAIARQTGRSRSTIDIWLQQPAPHLDPSAVEMLLEDVHPAVQPRQLPPPPAGWASWEDLQAVRATLADRRYLLLRRPDHLSRTEQARIDQALASPVGDTLQVARSFLEDWYSFWTDEHGQRRTVVEAQARYQAWCMNSAYQQVAPLQQVIKAVDAARFEQLGHFLKHPTWEATNNGAERVGRRFRQLQGPHFNLRTARSIEQALTAQSYRHYELATQPASPPSGRSGRGRKPASARQVSAQ